MTDTVDLDPALRDLGRQIHARYSLAARIARSTWPAEESSPDAIVAATATLFIELSRALACGTGRVPAPATTGGAPTNGAQSNGRAYAPSEKQLAFYQRLAESPVFAAEERRRSLDWLATKATRQTIKDQIDWLKRTIDERKTLRSSRPHSVVSAQPSV